MEKRVGEYAIITAVTIVPFPSAIAMHRGTAYVHEGSGAGPIVHTAVYEGVEGEDVQLRALERAEVWLESH